LQKGSDEKVNAWNFYPDKKIKYWSQIWKENEKAAVTQMPVGIKKWKVYKKSLKQ